MTTPFPTVATGVTPVGSQRMLGPGTTVRITVPATSANLGPGFDALGIALELRDTLEVEVLDQGLVVEVDGEGADDVPLDETHLVVRALRLGLDALSLSAPGLRLRCHNVVPHARGLGSSSAALIGGLGLARALGPQAEGLHDAAAIDLASRVEGHPDNVAPAVLGGFAIGGRAGDGSFWATSAPVAPDVRAVVFVPTERLSTELARGLLPGSVSHADAAFTAGRAALLVHALRDDPSMLLRATEDRLHQEQRRPAMPASLDLIDRLRGAGHAAVVSGAGPTVLVLSGPGDDPLAAQAHCPDGWRAMVLAIAPDGVRTEV